MQQTVAGNPHPHIRRQPTNTPPTDLLLSPDRELGATCEGRQLAALQAELHPGRAGIGVGARGRLPGDPSRACCATACLLLPGHDRPALHDAHVRPELRLSANNGRRRGAVAVHAATPRRSGCCRGSRLGKVGALGGQARVGGEGASSGQVDLRAPGKAGDPSALFHSAEQQTERGAGIVCDVTRDMKHESMQG